MILLIIFFNSKIILFDSVFGLKNNDEEFNCLPCIYWLSKMHEIPSGARFIIGGKKCINKQLSKHVTSAFKLCYSQIDAYHKKTYYSSGAKTFWVIQNNSLPLECIKKISKRKNAKQISTFDFSTLYTKIAHDKVLDILYEVVDFVFKGGTRDYILINKQGCASCSSKKRGHHFVFTKSLLKEAIKFLLHNCFLEYQWDLTQHHFLQISFYPTKKLTGLRHNVSLEQSMSEKSIIPFGILMTCHH